ncbi:hypothetical protein GCM10027053_34680 [Intrasporangium mesophilum]
MRRLALGAALAAALVPASVGLVGNATFSHSVPTPVPASAQLVPLDDPSPTHGTSTPQSSRSGEPEPGDDHGGLRTTRAPEPGDDHGGLRTTRAPEPGDDHGGLRTAKAPEAGDDHGGRSPSGASGTSSSGSGTSGRSSGSGGHGSDDTHPDDSRP